MKRIGIFTADLDTPGGSSRKGCLLADRLSRRYEVWLISYDRVDAAALGRLYGVSLADVRSHRLSEPKPGFAWSHRLARLLPSEIHDIVVQMGPYRRLFDLKLDLFIHNTSFHYMRAPAARSIFMCMFPWPMAPLPRARWCRLPLVRRLVDHALSNTLNRYRHTADTYDVITANSEFTASWVKRLWNREATVVYSATELIAAAPVEKRKHILAVGRFNNDKQQHVLIDAFRSMPELWKGGWQLHLAGKINPGPWAAEYHRKLIESAGDLPVVFHYDLPIEDLRALYRQSAIYWHAKGFGAPEDSPQSLEHFGNTPLEAMSAGCVPVVLDAGGLRETVQHGVNGFRWRTLAELREHTYRLAEDPDVLAAFRTRAMRIEPRFGIEPFLRATEAIVDELLATDGA